MVRESKKENNMARRIILLVNLVWVSLMVGGTFVVYLIYNPKGMSAAFYVETMQHGIRTLLPLAVLMFFGMFFTITSAIFARGDRASLYLLIATGICILTGVLLTLLGNWPINNQIITWNANSPPSNWTDLRDAWWRFHVARFVVGIIGLSCLLLATLKRSSTARTI